MAINLTYGNNLVPQLASLAGAYQAKLNRQQNDLQYLQLGQRMQDSADAQRQADLNRQQQVDLFKLHNAAQQELMDRQYSHEQDLQATKTNNNLLAFKQTYPEYAGEAQKAGRPLTASEVSDLRENARASAKQDTAAESQAKLAKYVQANGDAKDQEFFQATGKLSPKLLSSHTADSNKTAIGNMDQESKALQSDLKFAQQRLKDSSYDPKKEEKDIASAILGGKGKGYVSPYRKSDNSAAMAGRESDFNSAANDLGVIQQRIQGINAQRLALASGQGAQPMAPANATPPAVTGQPQPGPAGSTPTPGAPMPQQQTQTVTPEIARTLAMSSAARLKVSPSAVAQMRPATTTEVAVAKAQVMRMYSDPMAQRQAFYDLLIQNGIDPTKFPVAPQVGGWNPGASGTVYREAPQAGQ